MRFTLVGGFKMILREVGDCYADSMVILHLELRQSRGHGAWEVEIIDREQHRSISSQHDDEWGAREAVELGYRYGSQFGRWKIQRAAGIPGGCCVAWVCSWPASVLLPVL